MDEFLLYVSCKQMKLFIFISATAAVFTLSGCGKSSPQLLIGEWISPQGDLKLEVGEGGRLRLSGRGERPMTGSYSVDWSQTPPRIELVPDLKIHTSLTGLIQLDGENGLRLSLPGLITASTRVKNEQFDPETTILFMRKAAKPNKKGERPDLRPPSIPTIEQAQNRETAATIRHELQMLDSAVDQWAIDQNRKEGEVPTPQDVCPYLKPGTPFHAAFSSGRPVDSLGNPLIIPPVGHPPIVSEATVEKLSDSVPSDFWRPYDSK